MTPETPIACDLTAIDDDERERHRRATETLFRAVRGGEELSDGYAIRLPADTEVIEHAGAFVARERLCCPFFHFTLDVGPDGGPVRLEVTGRDGVKGYIEESLLPQLEGSGPDRG